MTNFMLRLMFWIWFVLLVIPMFAIVKIFVKPFQKGSVLNLIGRRYFIWKVFELAAYAPYAPTKFRSEMLGDALLKTFFKEL